jgi:hypothetical protein
MTSAGDIVLIASVAFLAGLAVGLAVAVLMLAERLRQ